jgi:integrase
MHAPTGFWTVKGCCYRKESNTVKRATTKTKKADNQPKRREFGTIVRRTDESYEARYWHEGKRYSLYFKTIEEAENTLDLIFANIKNDLHREGSSMLLRDWIKEWLNTYAKSSVRFATLQTYETYLMKHVVPELGNKTLRSLSPDDVQKFFNEKAVSGRLDGNEGGLSVKSMRNMRNAMNVCFKQATFNELILRNPLDGVKLKKAEPKDMRVLTVHEMETLIRVCLQSDNTLALGIVIALQTGVRIGELLGLQWADVDLASQTPSMFVKQTLARQVAPPKDDTDYKIVRCKPGNKTAVTLGKVKTSKSRRIVWLPDLSVQCLKRIRDWQDGLASKYGKSLFNKDGFVFTTLKGEVMETRNLQNFFHAIIKAAGIQNANFHSCRHTFATRGCELGIDLKTLADMLGHAQPSTTLNMYTHSFEEQKQKAAGMFDQFNPYNQPV